jgi:hypothetical protein
MIERFHLNRVALLPRPSHPRVIVPQHPHSAIRAKPPRYWLGGIRGVERIQHLGQVGPFLLCLRDVAGIHHQFPSTRIAFDLRFEFCPRYWLGGYLVVIFIRRQERFGS